MKSHAAATVSDAHLAESAEKWGQTAGAEWTKEAVWIRDIFEKHFPSKTAAETTVRWIPRTDWGMSSDPSGRAVKIHDSAYEGGEKKDE